jgi:hypothetical protein
VISIFNHLENDRSSLWMVQAMVVKNEFSLVKSTILRVKKHKTCKIGFKTRKPVKSVKPGQTRIKSGQPVKNVKSVSISRFHVKLKFKRVCHLSC